jgi:excisionase family DNA binding protein
MTSRAISTRQASDLLGVHESSVKRWCSSGELPCDYTPGGHRRILLRDLAPFSRERELAYALAAFGDAAETVWAGTLAVQKKDDYAALVDLLYGWLRGDGSPLAGDLLAFLRRQGVPLPALLDEVLAPVMYRVGTEYHEGVLSIGDEHRMTHLVRDLLVRLHFAVEPSPGAARPVAVVGCARSEVHELGALMSRVLLEDAGWRVVYLGLNVPTEEFARQQQAHDADLVCISMMPPIGTPEAVVMADVLAHLYDARHPYRLVFGGRAVSERIGELVAHAPHLDVQVFGRMAAFAAWVGGLDVAPPEARAGAGENAAAD